jgi:hypothetical protein
MLFLHINQKLNKNIDILNKYISQGKQLFILFYMEGCHPCDAVRPEWNKLENILKEKFKSNNNIVIVDIEQSLLNNIKYLKNKPKKFPCIRFISQEGKFSEDYEDCSDIGEKNSSIDSFVKWIEHTVDNNKNIQYKKSKNKTRKFKNLIGGKWSIKYKHNIDCNKPQGFSQRQYCKYGKKKLRFVKSTKTAKKK